MYINEIIINNFRAFSKQDEEYVLKFSPNINCISGHNGVGKSTILAMLSNIGELKKQYGTRLNNKMFRGEYSEVIKRDLKSDSKGDKLKVKFADPPSGGAFNDIYPQELDFRATFQKTNNGKDTRYRLLPKKSSLRKTESKLAFPTYYLGLSRLFPVGESENIQVKSIYKKEYTEKMIEDYKEILNRKDATIEGINLINLSDTNKKQGIGIVTDQYDYQSNSAGQDNIGQIIIAIYSFEVLKEKLGDKYFGGILAIDEIDATIHPGVQNRLVDYLEKKSKQLTLQIFFTTHSNTLLKHLIKKRELNKKNNNIKINYLFNSRGFIEIEENPTDKFIINNLTETYANITKDNYVNIVTEDKVAQELLKEILKYKKFSKTDMINYVEANGSWTTYAKLFNASPQAFNNFLFILDPDLNQKDMYHNLCNIIDENYIGYNIQILPGENFIEKEIWEWVYNIDSNHKLFYDEFFSNESIFKHILINNGPYSNIYEDISEDKKKLKRWFKDNSKITQTLIKYWIVDNEEKVNKFYGSFNKGIKKII